MPPSTTRGVQNDVTSNGPKFPGGKEKMDIQDRQPQGERPKALPEGTVALIGRIEPPRPRDGRE